jgi:hypothetical protein
MRQVKEIATNKFLGDFDTLARRVFNKRETRFCERDLWAEKAHS